ncbi:MAG TPA: hypothetical protein VKC60_15295 [Opitutaceae bacterium]|nr:hypothetical protein [Opitutaceae bacterium]
MKNIDSLPGMKACALLLVASLAFAPLQVFACGKERWSVKTVADKDAAKVQEAPTPSTINQLRQIAAPLNPNHRPDSRYNPTELTTYEVTGYITLIKPETDQDYHIVLTDENGRTMIVESTHPDCAQKSRFKAEIDQVRAALDQAFKGPVSKPIKTRKLVTVTGVGFFDHLHHQTGVAPNGIELHPILQVVLHDHKSIQEFKRVNRAKRAEQ